MSKIRTMKEAADRLTELGSKGKHVFRTLADAQKAVANAETRQADRAALQSLGNSQQ